MPIFVKEDSGGQTRYLFWCPGCGTHHVVRTEGPGPVWQWNGDVDKPTVSPSILVWRDEPLLRCHSFIRDGMIQYLDDCSHTLKGQTIALVPVDLS